MSDHVLDYLDAYYDGELNARLSQKVEKHLESCIECREAYQAMQQLSVELQAFTLPEFTSADRFSSQVMLCLPREQEMPIPEKAFQIGWWMIPVLLISAGVINAAVIMINNTLLWAYQFGWVQTPGYIIPTISLESFFGMILNYLASLFPLSMQWMVFSEHFIRPVLSNLVLELALAILYLCWIAIWWIKHTRQGSGQSSEQ